MQLCLVAFGGIWRFRNSHAYGDGDWIHVSTRVFISRFVRDMIMPIKPVDLSVVDSHTVRDMGFLITHIPQQVSSKVGWIPPSLEVYKLNTDGSTVDP